MYRINNDIHYIHITPSSNKQSIFDAGFIYSPNKLSEVDIEYTSPYDYYESSTGKITKTQNENNDFIFFGRINHKSENMTFVEWFKEEKIFSSIAFCYLNVPYYFGKGPLRNDRERVLNEIDVTNLEVINICETIPSTMSTRKIIVVENGKQILYEWNDE